MWFTTYAITFPPRFLLWFGSRFMSEIILCLFSGFQFLSATAVLSQVPWEYSPSRNNDAEKPRERYLFLIPGQIYWSQWLDKLERRERKRGRREKSAPGEEKMAEEEGQRLSTKLFGPSDPNLGMARGLASWALVRLAKRTWECGHLVWWWGHDGIAQTLD